MISWRSNLLALAGLIALDAPAGAAPDDLCQRLFVPEGYEQIPRVNAVRDAAIQSGAARLDRAPTGL